MVRACDLYHPAMQIPRLQGVHIEPCLRLQDQECGSALASQLRQGRCEQVLSAAIRVLQQARAIPQHERHRHYRTDRL